jgi:polyhydroxyalkanoate synthase
MSDTAADIFAEMLRLQSEAAQAAIAATIPDEMAMAEWSEAAERLQRQWLDFQVSPSGTAAETRVPLFADPAQWLELIQAWQHEMPWLDPKRQTKLAAESAELWDAVLTQYGLGSKPDPDGPEVKLPRSDRRFADPAWREQPVYALIHQTYLLLAERLREMVDEVGGLGDDEREQLRFATKTVLDAMSPANFPLTNPVVLERTLETHGANLVKGMERLAADLEKGQLTHTDSSTFRLGENVACTPGKVVFETPLFQLIQYTPATEQVRAVPLVIFPPWINRFYILDLNPRKSFVKWAVEQGLTVFIVSWRSADETMAEVVWDDYVRAQVEAIDHVRARLGVPAVHAIGYCVAGTTLAATLAVLARRSEADKVRSATFFTAQVDFARGGELRNFIDEGHLAMIREASRGGYLDGRYMAATFNLLRGSDLIWNTMVNHYLLGEDYPAFDLLHWNGDVTNLPAKWHESYLRDLYRDNKLVQPDALSADGTPIDLAFIETPAYIQAGREDHIAPPESVWKLTEHISGPGRFVLAGSGHIAGVVNPPAARKYQYWTNEADAPSLEAFLASAEEHPGSWWDDWIAWLDGLDGERVPATGKRNPGGKGDKVLEDAPGRYVMMR